MDALLIFFRIIHIGSAIWFGGAIVSSFFLQPTVQAQPFMEHLMNRRKLGIMFPIVAALTILGGAVLYWRDSSGLQLTWITSPTGLAYTTGGLAAIIAFEGGGSSSSPASPSRPPSNARWPAGTVCPPRRSANAWIGPTADSSWRTASICRCSFWLG